MLKIYMGYSRDGGPYEGAVLVFANSAKEARVLTWRNGLVVDEWIDVAVKWLKDNPWLHKEMTSKEPHVIDSPRTCERCGLWGNKLDENGICVKCRNYRELSGMSSRRENTDGTDRI